MSELQQFDFKIMYKPGQDNTVDEFSRLPEELENDGEEFTVIGTAEEVMGGRRVERAAKGDEMY